MKKPTKLMIAGGVGLVITLILFYGIIPAVINNEIVKVKQLTPNTLTREMWEKVPFPIDLNIYLFNVTNPREVTNGEQPILQEIGPFSYDDYRWKGEVQDRESDDTVSYKPDTWFFFNKEKSGRLTGNEMVTVPNVLLLGLVTMVERDLAGILGMVNTAVNDIFRKPDTVYITVPVRELLFDGVLINCTVKEVSAKAVCAALGIKPSNEVKKVGKDMYKFSFLGGRNGTLGDQMRVRRGIKDVMDVGKMVEFKQKHRMKVWKGGSTCNALTGTDGTAFPPFLTKTDVLEVFAGDMCRSIKLVYVKPDVHRKVPVFRYTAGFGNIAANPDELCFCRSNATCPKKGTMDLTQCTGAPVILSLPHFYQGATQYQWGVKGLNPDKEKHEIFAEVEPMTGTPLSVALRMQFNVELHKVQRVNVMRKLATTMHPIMWMEEKILVPQEYVDILADMFLFALWLLSVLTWILILVFVGLFIYGVYLRQKKLSPVVTPEDSPDRRMDSIRSRLLST